MIQVRAEERRTVVLLLHSFCNGVAMSLLIAAAPALFVHNFEAADLPLCYIGTAIVLPVVSYCSIRWSARAGLRWLLFFSLCVLLVGTLGLRGLFSVGAGKWAAAMLVTWVDVQAFLLALEFETLVGSLRFAPG